MLVLPCIDALLPRCGCKVDLLRPGHVPRNRIGSTGRLHIDFKVVVVHLHLVVVEELRLSAPELCRIIDIMQWDLFPGYSGVLVVLEV